MKIEVGSEGLNCRYIIYLDRLLEIWGYGCYVWNFV